MEVFYFWIIACEAIIEKYHTLPPEAVSPAFGIQKSSENKRFSATCCHHERKKKFGGLRIDQAKRLR